MGTDSPWSLWSCKATRPKPFRRQKGPMVCRDRLMLFSCKTENPKALLPKALATEQQVEGMLMNSAQGKMAKNRKRIALTYYSRKKIYF